MVSVRVQLIRDQSVELYCGGHTQSAPVLSPLLLVPRAAPTRLIPWSWWCIFFSSSACLRAKKLALIDDAVNRAVGVWCALIESDTAFFLFFLGRFPVATLKKLPVTRVSIHVFSVAFYFDSLCMAHITQCATFLAVFLALFSASRVAHAGVLGSSPVPAPFVAVVEELRSAGLANVVRTLKWACGFGHCPGSKYLGVANVDVKTLANQCIAENTFSVDDAFQLMNSRFVEERLLSIYLLRHRYDLASVGSETRRNIVAEYIHRIPTHINNINLVDRGATPILGTHFETQEDGFVALHKLVSSSNPWERRSAMMSLTPFIKKLDFQPLENIAPLFFSDVATHVRAATGLMLWKAGRQDQNFLVRFLETHADKISKVTFDTAVAKMPSDTQARLQALVNPRFENERIARRAEKKRLKKVLQSRRGNCQKRR